MPIKIYDWNQKAIHDASYRHSEPLGVFFEKGINTLTISIDEGSFLLGNVTLSSAVTEIDAYEHQAVEGDQIITIEAEQMLQRNDSSIRARADFNLDLTPYNTTKKVLNLLDGWSFKDPGQKVDYTFMVEESGYYNLAFAYEQDYRIDFPVFRDIYIDRVIPNEQLKAYAFPYTKKIENLFMTDEETNEKMSIYLEKGKHTLSLVVNIDLIRHVIERIESMLTEINDFSLQVNKLTGGKTDKYRTIDIEKYIPGTQELLLGWADELESLYDSIPQYNPDKKEIGAFSQIDITVKQLRNLAKKPNEIPQRISELSEGSSSISSLLANFNQELNYNPLELDKIFFTQDESLLPKKSNIFVKISESVKRFINSFTDQAYSPSNTNSDYLQVWINRPRQYVEIIQKMADEYFTPQTGIEVDFSLMPDQNKLILSNASGKAPDVAAAVNYALPFGLAIREAIVDLTQFDDYEEVASNFPQGLLLPSMIDEGVYSIPETMNFYVLYYRKDVLDSLNIPVPQTMEEVKAILPELQRMGMNFYHQAAGMLGTKTFAATMPSIYQNGGSFYGDTVLTTTLDTDESLAGIKELTELFTIYNIPYEVPSFYQHFRSGILPIGIAEYGMYNLLKNAAPELANSWDIALIPGVENEEGAYIRYNEKTGYYYLFVSYGSLASDYHVRVGRSKQITGPYVDYHHIDMTTIDEHPNHIGLKITSGYKFEKSEGWFALGHNSVLNDNDEWYIIHHTRPEVAPKWPYLQVRKIVWTEDGWPLVCPCLYSGETIQQISKEAVIGMYERIEFNVDDPNLITPSVKAYFKQDQTCLIGSIIGTWSLEREQILVIRYGEEEERHQVLTAWDFENWKPTLMTTGLNSRGVCCWMKQID